MPFQTITFSPTEQSYPTFPKEIILPIQTHSANIIHLKTGDESLENCDGIITCRSNKFHLGIKTADCAAISFYDSEHYGIIHAGWRGLLNGIVEDMLSKFTKPTIHISPLLQSFEIQKDNCYDQIHARFDSKFLALENDKIYFKFQEALLSLLPEDTTFDSRDTSQTSELASWRRDRTGERNITIIRPNQS